MKTKKHIENGALLAFPENISKDSDIIYPKKTKGNLIIPTGYEKAKDS